MSFIRATSRVARSVTAATRLYSTGAGTKNSNLPLYLLGAGLVAAGAYGYTTFGKAESEKPKKVLTSALDPQKFVDVKLKRVEPYNHNTSIFVFELPEGQASLLPVSSCVYLKAEDLKDANGKPMVRPYTPDKYNLQTLKRTCSNKAVIESRRCRSLEDRSHRNHPPVNPNTHVYPTGYQAD